MKDISLEDRSEERGKLIGSPVANPSIIWAWESFIQRVPMQEPRGGCFKPGRTGRQLWGSTPLMSGIA